ncbi:MAG: hypothetical protein HDR47_03495 [Bacteroides sp.]|nr:hypothetical protein [Bacteroides sp.]MBD5419622.1 hypothetical protein [Bacteroides sp.]MBD5419630.1 hypothetical protein [Bacteroides sp.]MBD5420276.1 hypothetical protein [Bacteroides sp.]
MKKISLMMTLLLILGVAFTSCKEDTQPRLEKPTEFVLNTPPMANETYVLEEYDGVATQIYLTVSQPDYGLGTVTSYEVQLSKTEDFAEYQSLLTVNTQAQIQCDGYEWSVAMNALNGITSNDDADKFTGEAEDVYVRVRAFVPNADYSSICSNVIKLNVQPYFAVRAPGKLYVIGQVSGWDIDNGAIYLSEPDNGIGSKIYSGEIEISASDAATGFRFYTELGNWGDNGALPSIGSNADDGDNLSVTMDEDNYYSGPCVNGKGNWNITNWEGGKMKMTVDLNEMKVYFQKAN